MVVAEVDTEGAEVVVAEVIAAVVAAAVVEIAATGAITAENVEPRFGVPA